MPLNIGNVMKAMDDGKWIHIRNKVGEFSLKIKQMLPGEVFAYRKKMREAEGNGQSMDIGIFQIIADHIVDWKHFLDAEGNELPFNQDLLQNEKFVGALMNLSAPDLPMDAGGAGPKDGGLLFSFLSKIMARSDAFVGEEKETDFLGHI